MIEPVSVISDAPARAMPKSVTFTFPCGPTITLWGLKSRDRKSTRLNSSHLVISYAVFCLIKYSRKDARFVRELADVLNSRDLDLWVDWKDIPPTAEWLAEIDSAIDATDTLLFV